MKKTITLGIVLFLVMIIAVCSQPQIQPQTTLGAPLLSVSLQTDGMPIKRINAAQLTTSWYPPDGINYEADADNPLDLGDYSRITLHLENMSGEIELEFSDGYLPQSMSIQRWRAEYVDRGTEMWNKGEPVSLERNKFLISDDGYDYIYEVYASWEDGNSRYAFRLDSKSNDVSVHTPIAYSSDGAYFVEGFDKD